MHSLHPPTPYDMTTIPIRHAQVETRIGISPAAKVERASFLQWSRQAGSVAPSHRQNKLERSKQKTAHIGKAGFEVMGKKGKARQDGRVSAGKQTDQS